ncbi:MAG TPA: DoxX family protein [Acidimicrobiia bacterium]|nr:DoxX family protein [Acidimicrobiia bacterium]
MNPVDLALLVLRVVAGATFIAHGVNHGRNPEGTASWFAKVGFKAAALQARMSIGVEVGAGALLVVGLLTPLAAAALVATMVVAGLAIHRFNGFFVFRPGEGWEYVHVLGWVGFVIAWLGPGRYSLDQAVGLTVSTEVGLLVALGGVAAGLAQLVLFWRRPQPNEADS